MKTKCFRLIYKLIIMKKIIFSIAMFGTFAISHAATSEKRLELKGISILTLDPPCTVTINAYCSGSGTYVTSSATSPTGDQAAASTVASQQWSTDCKAATIRKVITEITAP